MPISSIAPTSIENDVLRDGPPTPSMRSAKPRSAGMPKSGSSPLGAGAAHLLGAGAPLASVMGDMMEIQKRIQSLSQTRPDIADLFSPIIGRARDMLAGSLADLAAGGTGTPPQDAGMPPPNSGMGGPMPPPPPGAM